MKVLPRKTGEVQLAVVGKGDKPRHMLLPAQLADTLQSMRAGQKPSARVFPLTVRRINYIVKAAAKRAGIKPAVCHFEQVSAAAFAAATPCSISSIYETGPKHRFSNNLVDIRLGASRANLIDARPSLTRMKIR
jgi:hypothetical protein